MMTSTLASELNHLIEACAAYVLSQAGEGWEHIDEPYNDGGWSG
jgi:hypothetical protein